MKLDSKIKIVLITLQIRPKFYWIKLWKVLFLIIKGKQIKKKKENFTPCKSVSTTMLAKDLNCIQTGRTSHPSLQIWNHRSIRRRIDSFYFSNGSCGYLSLESLQSRHERGKMFNRIVFRHICTGGVNDAGEDGRDFLLDSSVVSSDRFLVMLEGDS